jgi:hypothetical protein
MEQIDQKRVQVLLEHWQHHNEEHAKSYQDWANKLEDSGWDKVAEQLSQAVKLTLEINKVLDKARSYL